MVIRIDGTVYEYKDKEWEAIASGEADAPLPVMRWYIRYLRGLVSHNEANIAELIKSRASFMRKVAEYERDREEGQGREGEVSEGKPSRKSKPRKAKPQG